ncbi:hypothetical protein MKX08_007668 [Trichoderma sp. CBMAI-0020]|nr:hypothetical protein MKX08_007668 [Trichoderma sp. CBMAI-0020]
MATKATDPPTEDTKSHENKTEESQTNNQPQPAQTNEDQPKDGQAEKSQPWKAGWIARNKDGVEKPETKGLSHGTEKGDVVVIGGFTSGVAIKMTLNKTQQKTHRDIDED